MVMRLGRGVGCSDSHCAISSRCDETMIANDTAWLLTASIQPFGENRGRITAVAPISSGKRARRNPSE